MNGDDTPMYSKRDMRRAVLARVHQVKSPAALLDMCTEALRRCDELEARINKLEMK